MLPKISRARSIVDKLARDYLKMTPWQQRLYLGDDYQRKLDSLAVLVAAYDYARAIRALPIMLPSASAPVALLDVPEKDSYLHDVAPSFELVLELRLYSYSLDIDSLSEDDAVDLAIERDWCDFWYDWHTRQLA